MASGGVLARARPAIEDYLAQSYANRELVIGAARPQAALADFVSGLRRSDVRLVALPDAGPGPLPAALIAAAGGELVCGWDEDTAHDPRRLEMQQRVRASTRAAANFLRRQLIWQPASGRIGVSGGSAVTDSILGPRAALAELADAPSQAAWLDALGARMGAAAFNVPRLLVKVARDDDPAAGPAFETAWATAATRFAAERAAAVVEELSSRMRLDDHAGAVSAEPPAPAVVARRKVLVLTPMKNARPHLATYFRLLAALEADGARLSVGFLESDSGDGTHASLVAAEPWLHRQFARVTVLRQDYGFHPTGPRSAPRSSAAGARSWPARATACSARRWTTRTGSCGWTPTSATIRRTCSRAWRRRARRSSPPTASGRTGRRSTSTPSVSRRTAADATIRPICATACSSRRPATAGSIWTRSRTSRWSGWIRSVGPRC